MTGLTATKSYFYCQLIVGLSLLREKIVSLNAKFLTDALIDFH